jgi:DNA-binding Lrp family transcriptional regulator
MSTKAYILIETTVEEGNSVVEALRLIPGICDVDPVTGPYDIIAIIKASDLNAVGSIITNDIHTITGIIRTVTCLSFGLLE